MTGRLLFIIKVVNKFPYLLTYLDLLPCASPSSADRKRAEEYGLRKQSLRTIAFRLRDGKQDRIELGSSGEEVVSMRARLRQQIHEIMHQDLISVGHESRQVQCSAEYSVASVEHRYRTGKSLRLWQHWSPAKPRAHSGAGDCVRLPADVRSEMWITLVSCSMGGHYPRCHIGKHLPLGIRRQYTSIEHTEMKKIQDKHMNEIYRNEN